LFDRLFELKGQWDREDFAENITQLCGGQLQLSRSEEAELVEYLKVRYGLEFSSLFSRAPLIIEEIRTMIDVDVFNASLAEILIVGYCALRITGRSTGNIGGAIKRLTMGNASLWFDFIMTHPLIHPEMRAKNNKAFDSLMENIELAKRHSDRFWDFVFTDSRVSLDSPEGVSQAKKNIRETRKTINDLFTNL
jgi:hypothetical protein